MENKQLKSFKDLTVWQKAVDLASLTYEITEKFPKSELYGLAHQMRRAAISISSNIAEGFKRHHKKEKLQFYNVAYGSAAELESQTEVACRLNFIGKEGGQKLNNSVREVSKMIDGLIKAVNKYPKSYILNSIFLLVAFFIYVPVYAQETRVYFDSPKDIYHPDETQIVVDVLLDSDIEVNAFSLEIGYNVQAMAFRAATDQDSIVDVWQDFPPQTGEGVISLQGGMIKPFSGRSGLIARLIFVPIVGSDPTMAARVVFRKAILYRADGKATPLWPKMESKTITISSAAPPPIDIVYDRTPPKVSDINTTRNPEDNVLLLSFQVSDDRSGVGDISVRWRNWIFWGPYWPARSPLAAPAGAWSAQIKAVDGAGNEEIQTVVLWGEAVKKLLLALLAIGLAGWAFKSKIKMQNEK